MVLHHLRSVVIAVRGTETPEDLITDGLCGECSLSVEDLDGLIKQVSLPFSVCVYHHLSMSLFSPISMCYMHVALNCNIFFVSPRLFL